MGVYHDSIEGLFWLHHEGRASDEQWDGYVRGLREAIEPLVGTERRMSIITLAQRADPPNARQRRALADVIQTKLSEPVVRHAFVSDSVVLRGVLTALGWLAAKPYEERTFTDPLFALDWLHEGLPFDRAAAIRQIVAAVPADELHTGLRGR